MNFIKIDNNMKKKLILTIVFLAITVILNAQSVSVFRAVISPTPLQPVEQNGTGIGEIWMGELSGQPVPATVNNLGTVPNVYIGVSLQYIELTNGAVSGITGNMLDYFTVNYDATQNVIQFVQSQEIPAETLLKAFFPITVIQNSTQAEALNGYNTNISAIDGNTDASGSSSVYTYTQAITDVLQVTKTVTTPGSAVGDVIEYDIVVANTGTTDLTNIVVTDANADAGTLTGSPIATLASGTSVTLTAQQTITQADVDAGYIENSATATGNNPDGNPISDVSDAGDETVETPNGDGSVDNDSTNDPTVTTITDNSELTLTKTVATTGSAVGDVIVYDILVKNTGNTTLTNIDVVDANADANSITGSPITTLAPGSSATVTAEQTITQADLDAGYIQNSATATGDSPTGVDDVIDVSDAGDENVETPDGLGNTNGDSTDDPTVTMLASVSELTVTKTITTPGSVVGDVISYDIVVKNTGTLPLTNIVVTDVNADAGSIIGSPIATLAPGASATVTATQIITQADFDAGYIENSATASGLNPDNITIVDVSDAGDEAVETPNGDGTTDNDPTNDPTVTNLTPISEMIVTKIISVAGSNLGDVIAYNINVQNTGNTTLTNIDVVDANADNITGSPITSLAPGTSATVTATQTITQADFDAGFIENSATATGDSPNGVDDVTDVSDAGDENVETPNGDGTVDNDPTNDPTVTTLTPTAEMTVTKTVNTSTGTAVGHVLTYDILVKNTGTLALTNVIVTDANADSITGSPITTLAPGASVTVTATQTITQADIDAGYIENSATATGNSPTGTGDVTDISDAGDETVETQNGDGTTDNDPTNDPTVTNLSPISEMTVTKTVASTTGTGLGDTYTYEILVANTGNTTLTNIVVTDANADSITGSPISSLAPGASVTVTATQIVTQADLDKGYIENSATATGNSPSGTGDVTDVSDAGDETVETPDGAGSTDNDPTNDPTVTTITPISDMTVTKTVASTTGTGLGDVYTYDILVTNTGATTLTNILVVDANADGGVVTGSPITTLAPGSSVTVTATQTITQADIDAGYIENSATATGNNPDGNPISDVSDVGDETVETPDGEGNLDTDPTNDPTVTVITPNSEMTITKVVNVSGSVLGDVIAYNIFVENTGNTTLTNVVVTDANADGGVVTGSPIATLAPGTSVIVTANQTITQADIDAGYVENSATATGDSPNGTGDVTDVSDAGDETVETPDGEGNLDTDPTNDPTVTYLPVSEMTVTKTVNSTTGTGLGDVFTYDIVVENTGNTTLTNVVVTDDNADSISGSPIATLAPGESVTVTAIQTITQADLDAGYVENSATATGEDPDGNPVTDVSDAGDETVETPDGAGNTDSDPTNDPTVTTITQTSDMTVTKTVNVTGSALGDVISYIILVKNTGNTTLTNIVVTDDNADAGSIMGSPISSLAPGASVIVTANQTITQANIDAGYIENSATVTGNSPNGTGDITDVSDAGDETVETPNGAGNTDNDPTNDPTVTTITPNSEIRVTKTVASTTGTGFDLGNVYSYDILVENTGNTTLTNIIVTDANADAGSITGSPIATLAPGESVTVTATQTITQADIDAGYIENSATATGNSPNGTGDISDVSDAGDETVETSDGAGNTDNDPTNDPTVTTITTTSEMTVTKTVASSTGTGLNGVFTYDILVKNTGNTTLTNIVVTDANADSITGSPIMTLAPGESVTVTATQTVSQADLDAGYVENSATATGNSPTGTGDVTDISDAGDETVETPDGEGNTDNDPTNDPTVTTITPVSDMTVTKTVASTTGTGFDIGDVYSYDILVENTGDTTLTNIVVVDANADGGVVTGSPITSLSPGASITVTATQTITQADVDAGYIENSATATGINPSGISITDVSDAGDETVETPDGEGNTDNDPTNDPTVTSITPNSEMTITKVVNVSGSMLGDIIAYNIFVENTGNTTLTNIVVTDANADGGIVTGSPIATLAPGESVIVTANQTITQADIDAGYIENSAAATGSSPTGTDDVTDVSDAGDETVETPDGEGNLDTDPTNDPTVTEITPNSEMTVTKTVTTAGSLLGDVFTYDIVVANTGNTTLTNIVVTDDNADAGSITGSPIATLAPGETVTVTATQTITQTDIDNGYVENSASVEGEDPDGNPVTDISDAGDETVETPDGEGNTDGDTTNDPTVTSITNTLEANDDDFTTDEDVSMTGNIYTNDVDPEGDTFSVTNSIITTAQGVEITIDPMTGEFNYTPPVGYVGEDSFEYTICDNGTPVACDTATVKIVVAGVGGVCEFAFAGESASSFKGYSFSPNDDGINDLFHIENLEFCFPNYHIQIFNRYGNVVFEYTHNGDQFAESKMWDGSSDGRMTINKTKMLPAGTYFFVLDLNDPQNANNPENDHKSGYIYLTK